LHKYANTEAMLVCNTFIITLVNLNYNYNISLKRQTAKFLPYVVHQWFSNLSDEAQHFFSVSIGGQRAVRRGGEESKISDVRRAQITL